MTVKVRWAASSTAAAIIFAFAAYSLQSDTAHRLLGTTGVQTTDSTVPAPADYDSRLSASYMALDSSLPTSNTAAASTIRLTVPVGDGQTLAGLLTNADVPADEAHAAIEVTRGVYDPRKLRRGQFVTVNFASDTGAFRGFEIQADPERRVTVSRGLLEAFSAQSVRQPMKTQTLAARGTIHNSLFESAGDAGVPNQVTAAMIRAFSFDVDFQRDIQPGDRFEVMYDTMIGDGGGRPGDVLFAELTLSGKRHTIYGYRRDDGPAEFFTADGKSIRSALLRTPVDGARLASSYGIRRHPILGYTRMHKGVDFAVPTGTPIFAAGDGVIEQSGWWGTYGRYVRIRHGGQMATAYAHMSRIAPGIATGQHIHQGQVIGYVGMTGGATGPHLHYEMLKGSAQVNPISVTLPVSKSLEGEDLIAFNQMTQERGQRFAVLVTGNKVAVRAP